MHWHTMHRVAYACVDICCCNQGVATTQYALNIDLGDTLTHDAPSATRRICLPWHMLLQPMCSNYTIRTQHWFGWYTDPRCTISNEQNTTWHMLLSSRYSYHTILMQHRFGLCTDTRNTRSNQEQRETCNIILDTCCHNQLVATTQYCCNIKWDYALTHDAPSATSNV
jgi:hypothetical protein